MTSATGISDRGRRAFSLLELIFVLAMVLMIAASLAILVVDDPVERMLQKNAKGIETLISGCKSHTILQMEDCVLRIRNGRVLQAAGVPSGKRLGDFQIDKNLNLFWRRTGDNGWDSEEDAEVPFLKSGLNAPAEFRLVHKEGVCELIVHPLTGAVEQRLEIP